MLRGCERLAWHRQAGRRAGNARLCRHEEPRSGAKNESVCKRDHRHAIPQRKQLDHQAVLAPQKVAPLLWRHRGHLPDVAARTECAVSGRRQKQAGGTLLPRRNHRLAESVHHL